MEVVDVERVYEAKPEIELVLISPLDVGRAVRPLPNWKPAGLDG